jgi:hypothetical protein
MQEYAINRTGVVYKNMKDPSILKYIAKMNTISMMNGTKIEGSSPPDIFVGRFGYPKVFIGPMVPPVFGDTMLLGTPEKWVGKSIEDIIRFRSTLVRGMAKVDVKDVLGGKIQYMVEELALADKYVDSSITLTRKPMLNLTLDDNSQPYGPSAGMKEMELQGNIYPNRKIEKAHSDTSMNASQAAVELYKGGIPVSKIQKAFSSGLLGTGKRRRFVPTRWSITAVDDTLGKENLAMVKTYEPIDSYMVFETYSLDNRWLVLFAPGAWSYELVEAWYPNTTWNMGSKSIDIGSSYEFFDGRKTYAEIGGCYYAARLAVSELLDRMKKQATVTILREVHEGYTLPVGVWNVREHVRAALRSQAKEFATLNDALAYMMAKLEIRLPTWIDNSAILRYLMRQRRLVAESKAVL